MLFYYKAVSKDGKEAEGSVDSSSVDTAISALQITKKEPNPFFASFKAYAAIALCLAILSACFINMYKFGISLSFIYIFLSGCLIAYIRAFYYKSEAPVIADGTTCCK